MIQDIFSVGISSYNLHNIDNYKLVEYAKKTSNKNKFKETEDILSNDLFIKLNNIVKEKMNEYYSSIYNGNHKIKLFKAWSNLSDDNYITIPHTHNESIVSAVYYPHSVEGEIIFLNPAMSVLSLQKKWMVDNYNKYTSEYFSVEVKTGNLIVFNSMLCHMVKCKDKNRVSIAYEGVI